MQLDEFFIEEYKSLRGEIYSLVDDTRKLEILALCGIAAMYAWFATEKLAIGSAWYAPTLLPFFGALRSYALFKRIGEIGDYLREFEKKWNCPGWETHFATQVRPRISYTATLYWIVLLLVTIVAPSLLTY